MDEIVKKLEEIIEERVWQRTRDLYQGWSKADSDAKSYAESLKLIVEEFSLKDKIREKTEAAKKEYESDQYENAMSGGRSTSKTFQLYMEAAQWERVVEELDCMTESKN